MKSKDKASIAIFASGSGTNAEAIANYFKNSAAIKVRLILSNKPDAFVLTRAKHLGIPTRVFTREQFRETGEVIHWLEEAGITHIVLAGFLWLVPEAFIKKFPDRIINIHPALLPKYGGKGMFGANVHEAVKQSGDRETGITIHLVNEKYDEGRTLLQAKCPVEKNDSPEQIAAKVHVLEYEHYPKVIEQWILEGLG